MTPFELLKSAQTPKMNTADSDSEMYDAGCALERENAALREALRLALSGYEHNERTASDFLTALSEQAIV